MSLIHVLPEAVEMYATYSKGGDSHAGHDDHSSHTGHDGHSDHSEHDDHSDHSGHDDHSDHGSETKKMDSQDDHDDHSGHNHRILVDDDKKEH